MKKFSGNRSRAAVRAAVLAKGWRWDDERYEAGSDWTTFGFEHDGRTFDVVWCSFNGRFIVDDGGKCVSESSTNMDGVPWYDALLDFIYLPAKEPVTA